MLLRRYDKSQVLLFCIPAGWLLAGCQAAAQKPLIGIIGLSSVPAHIQAIEDNGGTPFVIPITSDANNIKDYIRKLDGLVLTGGKDISPAVYGQAQHPTTQTISNEQYELESKLIKLWLAKKKPILGVCLGMQFANVVAGGTLIQDIPSQIGTGVIHRGDKVYHNVKIDPDSKLAKILGKTNENVLSIHHQAVDKLGKNLKIVARSDDGVAEAMECIDCRFGLFLQWHLESMHENLEHRNAIYGSLIKSCRKTNLLTRVLSWLTKN
jgi:putative glutamine amidotransferase